MTTPDSPSTLDSRFIVPLDMLFLRGNQLFGAPGSYGESLMPPWPSVAAGAIRSRILADAGIDLAAFGEGLQPHPELGTPTQPGSFVLQAFHVARQQGNKLEMLLSEGTRSAEDGKLFTNRAVALKKDVGFVAAVAGAQLPDGGLLRLGGDGRAASIGPADMAWPQPDYERIAREARCRIVLTSPGLFTQGWLPNGFTAADSSYRFDLHGVQGRLVAASVARSEVVSGWNLAGNQGKGSPKPAQRIAPTGSVYWLDELHASPDALRKFAAAGLWGEPCEDVRRRAEGFNRFSLALY